MAAMSFPAGLTAEIILPPVDHRNVTAGVESVEAQIITGQPATNESRIIPPQTGLTIPGASSGDYGLIVDSNAWQALGLEMPSAREPVNSPAEVDDEGYLSRLPVLSRTSSGSEALHKGEEAVSVSPPPGDKASRAWVIVVLMAALVFLFGRPNRQTSG